MKEQIRERFYKELMSVDPMCKTHHHWTALDENSEVDPDKIIEFIETLLQEQKQETIEEERNRFIKMIGKDIGEIMEVKEKIMNIRGKYSKEASRYKKKGLEQMYWNY